jgi:hypothetical protein|tara:strand:+ start:10084 stop:10707 length:624 start_codon:yes stop_codon:yes gene_type:complete
MAFFTDYTSLQSTVASYLARTDLTTQIPEFIRLGETRLRRDLRLRQMIKVSTAIASAGDGTVEIPDDFLAMKDLHIQGNPPQTIQFLSTSNFFRNARTADSGLPRYYTLLGSEFQFAPVPDSDKTIQMVYYYQPDYLSDTNSSNLWLANTPDLLLYAALGEAEPYLMNDERLQTWAAMYDRALNSITKSDDESEFPAQPMTITNSMR